MRRLRSLLLLPVGAWGLWATLELRDERRARESLEDRVLSLEGRRDAFEVAEGMIKRCMEADLGRSTTSRRIDRLEDRIFALEGRK